MDSPRYTATLVHNFVEYTMTHGEEPDPAADVVLGDPLRYSWGFENELIPGQLLPSTSEFTLVARTAGDVPDVDEGDLVVFSVVTAGVTIVGPVVMRVASVDVGFMPKESPYRASCKITAVDALSELGSLYPHAIGNGAGSYWGRIHWRCRFAEFAVTMGRAIGCGTWWGDREDPPYPDAGGSYAGALDQALENKGGYKGKSARDLLTSLLNSHQPNGHTHTVAAIYSADGSWPAGYRRVGPDVYWGDRLDNADAAALSLLAAETALPVGFRYLLVPASRHSSPGAGYGAVELDGSWCDLPSSARRARGRAFNVVNVLGEENVKDPGPGYVPIEAARMIGSGLAPERGAIARELPTQLDLGYNPPATIGYTRPAVTAAAGRFLSDASDFAAPWAYDAFTLRASRMPQADALAILPYLAPRLPGETDGDGQVLRHITFTNVDDELEFPHSPGDPEVAGFVTAGTLTVQAGDLVWSLRTTPGLPIP